jgi:hypothetical protein
MVQPQANHHQKTVTIQPIQLFRSIAKDSFYVLHQVVILVRQFFKLVLQAFGGVGLIGLLDELKNLGIETVNLGKGMPQFFNGSAGKERLGMLQLALDELPHAGKRVHF